MKLVKSLLVTGNERVVIAIINTRKINIDLLYNVACTHPSELIRSFIVRNFEFNPAQIKHFAYNDVSSYVRYAAIAHSQSHLTVNELHHFSNDPSHAIRDLAQTLLKEVVD